MLLQKRRIAELMSQLPLELDVEKLVGRALGAAGNTSDASVHNGGWRLRRGTGNSGRSSPQAPEAA